MSDRINELNNNIKNLSKFVNDQIGNIQLELRDAIIANKTAQDLRQAQAQAQANGIVLDYKIFAEVVNALSTNPENRDLYEKIVAIGGSQFKTPVNKKKEQAEIAATSATDDSANALNELNEFLNAFYQNETLPETKECNCQDCGTNTKCNENKEHENIKNRNENIDEVIKAKIKKEFPGAKIISPANLLNLLGAMLKQTEDKNPGTHNRL